MKSISYFEQKKIRESKTPVEIEMESHPANTKAEYLRCYKDWRDNYSHMDNEQYLYQVVKPRYGLTSEHIDFLWLFDSSL